MVCVSELDQPALDGIILKSVREAESAGLAPIDASCDGLGNFFFGCQKIRLAAFIVGALAGCLVRLGEARKYPRVRAWACRIEQRAEQATELPYTSNSSCWLPAGAMALRYIVRSTK
jgi:hypothetical protein